MVSVDWLEMVLPVSTSSSTVPRSQLYTELYDAFAVRKSRNEILLNGALYDAVKV